MESRKYKIAVLFAKYFLRTGRGKNLTARFTDIFKDMLDGTVYLFAIKGFFGITIESYYLIGIVLAKSITEYFLGWADQKWGFWMIENAYSSNNLNPWNEELMNRIKNIQEQVNNGNKYQ